LRSWALKRSHAVIANSRFTADGLVSAAGVQSPVVVPNGIEPHEFEVDRVQARRAVFEELGLPTDSFLVANIGILCSRKNQLDAVEVARRVSERHPEVRFICVGSPSLADTDYVNRLRARINEFGLTDNIHLLGLRTNVVSYLAAADLLLHTAVSEPQGRVMLEAMAARVPVVAYRVGGIPESVVDGETGLLVPLGDIGAAAAAVCHLISDPALRSRMGEAGRSRVLQHFTAEATARAVDKVIQSVLLDRRRPRSREPVKAGASAARGE
jgi:glycosyltransferase involved in cell wall biosynthesis